ncbi:MAG: replication factor C large subunit [Candidatus Diapherotrites archaeon]|nr:replication factor C large subunit [Candidatus Diapherotrites archaeon]
MLSSNLFTDKFFPKDFEEFIGNVEIVDRVRAWATAWQSGANQKPLLFYGNPGVGKTALAYLIAKDFGWQLFEMNASDLRDKVSIEKIVGAATANSSLFGSKRLILLDEVDGLQSKDRGGAGAIVSILKESTNPVILTANDVYADKSMAALRSSCVLLEFKKINYLSIARRLREICTLENIKFDDEAIKELARNCSGDFRSALLDTQSLEPNITLDLVKALYFRERKEKIFSVMSKVFKGKSLKDIRSSVDSSDVSFDTLSLWVEENIPRQFDSLDTANAFNVLSRADIFNGRIMLRQHWGFLKYFIPLSTAGVGLSKSHDYNSFIPLAFPTILSSLSSSSGKRSARKEIAGKIGEKMHCSRNEAIKDLPFLSMLFNSEKFAKSLVCYFSFDEAQVAFLLGKKPDNKAIGELVKEAKLMEKDILIEKLHKKQTTLFG